MPANRKFKPALISWASIVLLAGACSQPNAASKEADGAAEPEQLSAWAYSKSIDKFTDQTVLRADRRFVTDALAIDVGVECRADGLYYELSTFTSAGEAAPLLPMWISAGPVAQFKVRTDLDAPLALFPGFLQFNNQIRFLNRFRDLRTGNRAPDFSSADRVLFGLPTEDGGEGMIEIDQTDPTVRSVIQTCVTAKREIDNTSYKLAPPQQTQSSKPPSSHNAQSMGVRPGVNYEDARQSMISSGQYRPVSVSADSRAEECQVWSKLCEMYPEFLGCSGTGINLCQFGFLGEDGVPVIVETGGEPGDNPGTDISVNNIRAPEDFERQYFQ